MGRAGNGSAWGSLLAGAASVATLPLAVFLTRFSDSYNLLHAGFAIPLAAGLGLAALLLGKRAARRVSLSFGASGPRRLVRAGRVLGFIGVCMAAAGLVSLGVYGLLEYVGSRG